MRGRTPTKAEQAHMDRVRELGCLIHVGTPAVVHHLQCCTPRNPYITIPLCPDCHTGTFSIHATKQQFLAVYGNELKLLAETIKRL